MDSQLYAAKRGKEKPENSDFETTLKKLFKYSSAIGFVYLCLTGAFKVFVINEDLLLPICRRIYHTGKVLAGLEDGKPGSGGQKAAIFEPRTGMDVNRYYWYTVRRGETLQIIAAVHGMTLRELLDQNPEIEDPDAVKYGITRIKVKVWKTHEVRPGDIFRVVAKKYRVSKKALMEANGATKDHTDVGQKLIIPFNGYR